MNTTIEHFIEALCDGDKNLPSREAITLETLEKLTEE